MQLFRKLIILNPVKGIGKGMLKIEAIGDKVNGIISITEPKGSFRLGIRIGYSRLYEYDIDKRDTPFVLEDGLNIADRIECVVLDNGGIPIMYATSDGNYVDWDNLARIMNRDINLFKETSEIKAVVSNDKKSESIPEAKEQVILSEDKKVEDQKISIDEADFFESIRPQLEQLFKCYPADKELMRSVPDSKWVKVNYEKEDYYVVGVLYNGKRATHICYGVPGVYSVRPKQPSEWLPLDYLDPEGKGYWMIFQDAITGKTL